MVLRPHHSTALDPICVLGSGRVGPIIKHNRPQDGSIDNCLSKGWIQPPSEQENSPSGISFPLCNLPEVIERRDVSIEIFSLHLDG